MGGRSLILPRCLARVGVLFPEIHLPEFSHVVLGVFIWFNEMPMPPIIKGWNVRPVYVGLVEKGVMCRLIVMCEIWIWLLVYSSGT